MRSDRLFNIFHEVLIDRRRRVLRQQSDALRNGASHRSGRMHYRDHERPILDHDLGSGPNPRHKPGKVSRSFALRNVNHCHNPDRTSRRFVGGWPRSKQGHKRGVRGAPYLDFEMWD